MPQKPAGMRTEAAASLPCASGPSPEATAVAAPPLEPPDVRPCFHGLWVGPVNRLPESPFQPYSGVFVLPSMTAPAAFTRSTKGGSKSGTFPLLRSDPNWVGIPLVGVRSLIEIGTPASGPAVPAA